MSQHQIRMAHVLSIETCKDVGNWASVGRKEELGANFEKQMSAVSIRVDGTLR